MYVNKGSVTAIGIIFPVFAAIALTLRIYAIKLLRRGMNIDDILIIPATFLTVCAGVAMVIGAQMDIVGSHSLPAITAEEQHRVGKFEYAFWIGHVLATGFIKLAILFLFRRLFKGVAYRTAFDYANWTLIVIVVAWTLTFLFLAIFSCGSNPSAIWESLESLRTKCVDTFALYTANSILSWIMDLAILIEPLLMIGRLNMQRRRKIQTSLVFLCSILAVVAGLLRMIIWIQIHIQDVTGPTTKILGLDLITADQEAIVSIILFWTYIEIGIGLLVACLPPCAPLMDKISLSPLRSMLSSFSSRNFLLNFSQGSRSREVDTWGAPASQSWTARPKKSTGLSTDDEIELVLASERV